MNVEVLVIRGCPHQPEAASFMAQTLQDIGLSAVPVVTTTIRTEQEATQRGFPGSPTFLVNGRDPFAQPGATPALACRVYVTPDGLAGMPDARSLRNVLTEAADAEL